MISCSMVYFLGLFYDSIKTFWHTHNIQIWHKIKSPIYTLVKMLNVLYYPDKNFNLQTHCTLFLNLNYEKNFTMNFAVCEHFLMNKTKKESAWFKNQKKWKGK